MEDPREPKAMTATLSFHRQELNPAEAFWIITLVALLPALIAADILEKSPSYGSLPESDAYRSPLADKLLESNKWRTPKQDEPRDWRLPPPPPPLGWRSEPSPSLESSKSKKNLELFPRYQPGNQFSYDHIEREDKPQIKIFEFGSK